jgi:hypothetical protein
VGWSFVGSAKKVGWPKTLAPLALAAAFFLCVLWFTYPPTAAYVEGLAGDAGQLRKDLVEIREHVTSISDAVTQIGRQQAGDDALVPELHSQIRELRAELRELRREGAESSGGGTKPR